MSFIPESLFSLSGNNHGAGVVWMLSHEKDRKMRGVGFVAIRAPNSLSFPE